MDRGSWRATAHGVTKSQTHQATLLSLYHEPNPVLDTSVLFVLFICLKRLNVML